MHLNFKRISRLFVILSATIVLLSNLVPFKIYAQASDVQDALSLEQAYQKTTAIRMQTAYNIIKQYPDHPTSSQEPISHDFVMLLDKEENVAHVTEIITVINTNENHGIFLTIPETTYIKDKDTFHVNKIDNVRVEYFEVYNLKKVFHDFSTEERTYSKYGEKAFVLKIGSPERYAPGPHLYVIEYDVVNVTDDSVYKGDNYQVVYYNLAGGASDFTYRENNFVVFYPKGAIYEHLYLGAVDAQEVTDKFQPVSNINIYDGVGKQYSVKALPGDVKLYLFLAYKPGTFAIPPNVKELQAKGASMQGLVRRYAVAKGLIIGTGVLLSVLTIAYVVWVWSRFGKETFDKIYAPVFTPSKELEKMSFIAKEQLFNYERKRDKGRALSSQIIKWAIDKLVIIKTKKVKKLLSSAYETSLVKLKDLDEKATKAEKEFMDRLFTTVSEVNLKSVVFTQFDLEVVLKKGTEELQRLGVFDKDAEIESNNALKFLLLMATFYFLSILIAPVYALILGMLLHLGVQSAELSPLIMFMSGLNFFLTLGILIVAGNFMRRLSSKGISLYKELQGLYMYIDKAEIGRIKYFNDPDKIIRHYEKLLPYAVLFKLEKKWNQALDVVIQNTNVNYNPAWVNGNLQDFSVIDTVSAAVSDLATHIDSQIQSISSSSSSYSGGGVSIGGGFSGGGGGGFSGGSSSGGW